VTRLREIRKQGRGLICDEECEVASSYINGQLFDVVGKLVHETVSWYRCWTKASSFGEEWALIFRIYFGRPTPPATGLPALPPPQTLAAQF
jgi:hypothetical protein